MMRIRSSPGMAFMVNPCQKKLPRFHLTTRPLSLYSLTTRVYPAAASLRKSYLRFLQTRVYPAAASLRKRFLKFHLTTRPLSL
ncbi:uncharacterized protein BBOV_IV003700 [Babesia bovis T2Bo]|uniref:uncharacterized protein n=1 Tax=Babesia bovis T2Bo TaxID=484906 RepID=UPI001D5B7F58|nr:uncharacterized protein BBOV_IV003700 [Babesia bovis T2Bo]KAG6438468.1 hypothetical protein BBOV_IV003700 [Babesia bovis T2Bo]